MRAKTRLSLALSIVLAVVVGLSACGGGAHDAGSANTGSDANGIAARVAGVGTISEEMLNHWVPVEAVLLYQEFPEGPIPKGLVPDPPTYSACIERLRSTRHKLVERGPKPSTAQLKRNCEEELHTLKVVTLNTLVDWYWIIGLGAELGMSVTAAQMQQQVKAVNDRQFHSPASLRTYMELTGQTFTDLLLRAKVQLFEIKEAARAEAEARRLATLSPQQRQRTQAKLVTHKQWAERTTCNEALVTSACRQYRGTEAPGLPN